MKTTIKQPKNHYLMFQLLFLAKSARRKVNNQMAKSGI